MQVSSSLRCALLLALSTLQAGAGEITYTIQTVAGSSLVGDGGSALNAQLSDAQGLALDRQGNVYIADPNNHRVRKVNAAGIIQTVAGVGFPGFSGDGRPAAQARLNAPYGVAADGAGNLYIADLGNHRVRKVTPDGVITTVAGTGQAGSDGDGGKAAAAQLHSPRNVAVDSFGDLYIAEFEGHRIRMVTPDGLIQTVAGAGTAGSFGEVIAATSAQLAYPAGIAVDFTGTLYIADSGNQKVRKVFNGVMTTVPFPALSVPTGVASDGAGGIYLADSGNKRILRRTAAGAVLPVAGAFDSARDVGIDPFGNLFVADGHRVRLLTSAGFSTTFAGDGTFGFGGDGGPALAAVLNGPSGVAVDSSGNLYIADERNHRVRMVSGSGVISTVAGSGRPAGSAEGLPPTSTALDAPEGVLVDPSGALWIGEYYGDRIRKLTPGGAILTVAGNGTAGFNGDSRPATTAQLQAPSQTALDSAANLYIADSGNNRIRKVTASGTITTFAGTGAAGFSGDGGQASSAQLNQPRGVAVDAVGNLYIADTNNHVIRKVTPGGLITTVAGGGAFPLSFPRSVAAGPDQNLYIADTGNSRILKLTPSGDLSTIAGLGSAGFSGDGGDALAAQFSSPAAITMDTAGNIYVADFDNNRIRKLIPAAPALAAPVTQLPVANLVNAASLRDGPVAPGEILSIFADGIGPATGVSGVYEADGILDTLLSETQVLFDGRAAPLFSVQQSQINVQVPYEVAGLASTHVQVFHSGALKVDANLAVTSAAPGIYTLAGGTGPAKVVQQDGSLNSQTNPADPGSIMTVFATGEGQTNPPGISGKSAADPYPQPVGQLVLRVGGRPAEVLFAAEAPGAAGMLQINARIPTIVNSGAVPLSLTIGLASSQDGVTVFVK
jgi:trimeric autotransporter adhesin